MKRLLVIALLFAAACLFHQEAQAGGFGVSVRAPFVDLQVGGGRFFAPRRVQRVQVVEVEPVHVRQRFVRQRVQFVETVPVEVRSFGNCNGAAGFSYRSSVFGY